MQNKLTILTACVLTAGLVSAQESISVEGIMDELMSYKEEKAPSVETPASAAADAAPAKAEPEPEEAIKPVEAPAAVESIAAPAASKPVEESRAVMQTGDFQDGAQGMAEISEIPPEKLAARIYPRTLLERDHKTAEIDGMDAVDAAWSTKLVIRSYDLVSGAPERMKLGGETAPVDVAALFPQVEFPKGASAIYQPTTETIYIRNTRENLAVIETMLETMEVLKGFGYVDQVEIEAKFVEVSEGALEELGFRWNFNDPNHVGVGGSNLDVTDGDSGLFNKALRGNPEWGVVGFYDHDDNSFTDEIPEYGYLPESLPFSRRMDLGDGFISPSGDWSSFRFTDTFNSEPASLELSYTGGNAFDLFIRALDQSSGTDVLSAPRVLTRSGEEATIQVGELHWFPEVFEGDAAQATIPNVSYEDFQETLLGIELIVTPKVDDERNVSLKLNPRITELAGWQSYQLLPGASDRRSVYNHRQLEGRIPFENHDPIVGSLPIFKVREIETQVTIADGSTIGMGGLINEKVEAFEDKVPVLGSLPLVGRLFRSEGERAVKRNLLMFVTAKVVEPNGRMKTSRSFE